MREGLCHTGGNGTDKNTRWETSECVSTTDSRDVGGVHWGSETGLLESKGSFSRDCNALTYGEMGRCLDF